MNEDDATPEAISAETTDPNTTTPTTVVDSKIETLSKRVGWIWMLGGVAATLFGIGGASYRVASKLATKEDLEATMKAHATAHASIPPDQSVIKRLNDIDVWRASHEASYKSDVSSIKQSMDQLSKDQRELLDVMLRDRRRR